jgi:hypothetical protein
LTQPPFTPYLPKVTTAQCTCKFSLRLVINIRPAVLSATITGFAEKSYAMIRNKKKRRWLGSLEVVAMKAKATEAHVFK